MDKGEKQEQKKQVIHKGLFIADQRRKGNGGRIKSQSIPNKIEVQFERNQGILHQSEVEWVEIRRYNRKERRKDRPKKNEKKAPFKAKQGEKPKFQEKKEQNSTQDKKKNKYRLKDEDKGQSKAESGESTKNDDKKLKFKSKEQIAQKEDKKQEQVVQKQKQEEGQKLAETQIEESSSSQIQQNEKQGKADHRGNGKKQRGDKQNDKQSGSESEDDKTDEKGQKQKKEENDIVVVGKILKELENPFWKKEFVGIMQFVPNNDKKKGKFRERGNDSHLTVIMEDHFLDVTPIHMRLPKMQVHRSKETENILNKYIQKTVKFEEGIKGGAIRNKILDQLEEVYVLVKFDCWKGKFAFCNLIKVIGKVRTIDGECNCFLHEHQLNDFEHEGEVPKEKPTINPTQIYKVFSDMVFTIDPLTSTDLDDALSIKPISQNEFQIGIHIADVSAFLHLIDRQEIVKRTTSVYLPHQVYHMLPSHLVEICSLNPGVKRQAFSIFVVMNKNGEIVGESRLEKNLLTSRFKLAYEQAQSIMVDQITYEQFNKLHSCSAEQFKQLSQKLHLLADLGMEHRKERLLFDVFENRQLKFKLNEEKWPIDYSIETRFTAQKVVEEFMIIGNIEAAKKIVKADPENSLVIHHPTPSALGRKQFNEHFQMLKLDFHFDDIKQLQKDLLKVSEMKDISENIKKICYFKARRVQETANYKRYSEITMEQNSSKVHFALGLEYYTHFTSPMRRIGDIIVHEVLNSIVDPTQDKKVIDSKEIEQANWGRRNTKRLKKDLNEIYLCLMIYHTKKPIQTEGIVASFGSMSISIYIPLLDTMKEIMWDDMDIYKVSRNRQDRTKFECILYLDKRDARKDIIWKIEKFERLDIVINCTRDPPLRIELELTVKTNKGKEIIQPYY